MKSLCAMWRTEWFNEVLEEMVPAHMELWEVEKNSAHGVYLCDLDWSQDQAGVYCNKAP